MTSIYTINNKLNYYKQYYICSYCYNYIDNNPLKKHLVKADKINLYLNNNYETCSDSYDHKLSYTKCITCNRFLQGILNGPDIITFIEESVKNNETTSSFMLRLKKSSAFYFNDIYDNFGIIVRQKFNFSHEQMKNIHQSINELYGLPHINVINERAEDIYNYIIYGIHGFIPK
jgi:hypothetical protein